MVTVKSSKLGIIGIGHVGKAILTNLLRTTFFNEYVLIDTREDRVFGEALDQSHGTGALNHHNFKIKNGTYNDLADADMIIVAANHYYGDNVLPNLERQELLEDNIPELEQIMEGIMGATQEAILIFVSNPVDTWTQLAITEFGYPKEKCMGTGTMLDTARLRYTLAKYYQVDPKIVSAYMMGEHGNSAFATPSHIHIAGIPFDDFDTFFPQHTALNIEDLTQEIVEAASVVYDNKNGVTDAAIGIVTTELVQAIVLDEQTILPLTSLHPVGTYGSKRELCFGMPTKVGIKGIEDRYELPLNEWEGRKLEESFQVISNSIDKGKELLKKKKDN